MRSLGHRDHQRERVIRGAFDVVAAAQRASTLEALDATVHSSFLGLGFSTYVGLNVLKAGGRRSHGVLFGATHPAWERHYAERGYARHDAVLRELVHSSDPIVWSDLPKRRALSHAERNIYDEAADFGLTDGVITPIPHLDGSLSAVLLIGKDIEADDPQLRAVAHLMSLHYGAIGRRLNQQAMRRDARPIALSARQIECLKWVRHGKSSADIGDILGISAVTVDEYIATACSRLGVRTRVQAAVEATLMGLID